MTPSDALRKHGSDKVTVHGYGPIYDDLFGVSRSPIQALLEVGVAWGASLRGWCEAFPQARIYGLDLGAPSEMLPEQCRFTLADAADPPSLTRALQTLGIEVSSLDVIIEDTSHTFRDQVAMLLLLWDYLKPGGIYVVEDIPPSTPHTPFTRLGGVIHDLRHVQNRYDDVLAVFHKPH